MGFDSVKKIAAEFALDRAVKYVSKNPEKNLLTLMEFLEKVATIPNHKEMANNLKSHFEKSPWIMEQTKRIANNPKMLREHPFNENHLAPCPIIDAPHTLRKMVEECGAYPTHNGAEQVLEGHVAQYLDGLSQQWKELADDFKAGAELNLEEEVKAAQ